MSIARFHSIHPCYNLLNREIERDVLPFCVREGIGVLPTVRLPRDY